MSITIDKVVLKSFLVPCGISIFCQVTVMIAFIARKYYSNYAFQLVFYLIASNLLLSLGFMLSLNRLTVQYTYPQPYNSPTCIIQTLLINFGQLSTSIWTCLISYILLRSIQTSEIRTPNQLWIFLSLGFGLPAIMSIFPFALKLNGDAGYYCWLIIGESSDTLALLQFTIPSLLCIAFDLYAIIRVIMKMCELQQKTEGTRRLLFYPCIAMVCWVFRFISRIQYVAEETVELWITWAALITVGMQGIVSSFVYASNMQWCKCRKAQVEDEDQQGKELELVSMDSKNSDRQRGRSSSNPILQVELPRFRSYSNFNDK